MRAETLSVFYSCIPIAWQKVVPEHFPSSQLISLNSRVPTGNKGSTNGG